MESALRPRDIQARIRAGESPEDVARAAGVDVTRIAAFTAPVIAERDHVAGLAQTHPVRRRGETSAHRTLRNTVVDGLAAQGIDPASATWDAWKLQDRRWQVRVGYLAGGEPREALFVYDQPGRFSVADDEAGRRLIGDGAPAAPAGSVSALTPEVLDDELAIVRALQSVEERGDDADESAESLATAADLPADALAGDVISPEDADDLDDAYREADLTEVDGVYEIVSPPASNMDVLYDMLSSFDEDSVKIYAGLVHPKEEATDVGIVVDAAPAEEHTEDLTGLVSGPQEDSAEDSAASAPDESAPASAPRPSARPAPRASGAEPEQPALPETGPSAPRKRPARKRRASVPSWDEIVFGSPRPEEE